MQTEKRVTLHHIFRRYLTKKFDTIKRLEDVGGVLTPGTYLLWDDERQEARGRVKVTEPIPREEFMEACRMSGPLGLPLNKLLAGRGVEAWSVGVERAIRDLADRAKRAEEAGEPLTFLPDHLTVE